jgi:acyl-coenzyme A thioesterase PaaI-like protein
LTVEYKLNFLAPGDGDLLISRVRVIKPGRTLIVAQSDVAVSGKGGEKHCATALVTMMTLHGTPDHPPEDSRHEQD